jgi:hypothetical protein
LRNHFAQIHPEILKTFEEGWAALPKPVRRTWSLSGRLRSVFWRVYIDDTDDEYPEPTETKFTNWTACMYEYSHRGLSYSRNDYFYSTACEALTEKLEHEGSLYGFQPQPRSTSSEKDDGELNHLERLKSSIAIDAIDCYLENERIESLCRLTEKIEEHGPEALLSYFKENDVEWP